jgi:dolichol kinase
MNESNKRPLENENSLAGSLVIFAVLMVVFLLGLYLVQFLTFTTVWPMAALIGLFALAYFIPMAFFGRSDAGDDHR